MLDARASVWNLGEVIATELLLLFETERAVIGGNHLQVVALKPLPQLVLIPLFAKRRRHHPLRALESFALIERIVEEQILRAGLSVSRNAFVASLANFFE